MSSISSISGVFQDTWLKSFLLCRMLDKMLKTEKYAEKRNEINTVIASPLSRTQRFKKCQYFKNVLRSFVHEVWLESEASGGNVSRVSRNENILKRSNVIRTWKFIQQVQNSIDDERRKSIMTATGKASSADMVYEEIRYESTVLRSEVMSATTQINRLSHAKRLTSLDL